MSGRSAIVRAKISKEADKTAHRDHRDNGHYDDHFISGYAGTPTALSRPSFSPNDPYIPPQRARRRQSMSSAGSAYGYASQLRKPGPIIIASAIEKSDFRTHLDGMSSTLRGKIGKLLRVGDSHSSNRNRRPGTATASSDSDVRSLGYAPSISAVPSLSPSTSPSEVPSAYPSLNTPTSYSSRSKQQQASAVHKIRRFEGGGKLPQLGWKSMSNVRLSKSS